MQVVDPPIIMEKVGEPCYVFTSDELQTLAASIFSSISVKYRGHLPSLHKQTDHFPYCSNGMFGIIC